MIEQKTETVFHSVKKLSIFELCRIMDRLNLDVCDERDMQRLIDEIWPILLEIQKAP